MPFCPLRFYFIKQLSLQGEFPAAASPYLLRKRVLPFPEGNPRQGSGQKPSRTGSEFARLYSCGPLKVVRRETWFLKVTKFFGRGPNEKFVNTFYFIAIPARRQ